MCAAEVHEDGLLCPTPGPDGRVASFSKGCLCVHQLGSGPRARLLASMLAPVPPLGRSRVDVVWAPDGSKFALTYTYACEQLYMVRMYVCWQPHSSSSSSGAPAVCPVHTAAHLSGTRDSDGAETASQ